MKQEVEFARKIEEIKDLAKIQGGVVSKSQVEAAFGEIGMQAEQLGLVYEYLKEKKIGVDEKVDLDEYLSDDEVDYLNMYLESLEELPERSEGEKTAMYIGAMAGDIDAKNAVIEIMLPDIVDMAKLYTGQGVLIEDLIGEGNVAVSMGVDRLGALETPDEVPTALAQMAMNAMEELIGEEEDNRKIDDKMVDGNVWLNEGLIETAKELNDQDVYDEAAGLQFCSVLKPLLVRLECRQNSLAWYTSILKRKKSV